MSIEHNLKPTNTRIITADAPNANHYSFKEWTGDTDHITTGNAQSNPATVTMPNHSVVLNATYNPYRVLTVNQGTIIPGVFAPVVFGKYYNKYCTNNIITSSDDWIIPTLAMMQTLIATLGGSAGNAHKLKEANTDYWIDITSGGGASNSSNFNGRGGGYYTDNSHSFTKYMDYMSLRCSDYLTTTLRIAYNISDIVLGSSSSFLGGNIRLVKTSTTLNNGQTGFYVGNDGKVYPTICIGTQEWLSVNLAETKKRDGSLLQLITNNIPYFESYVTPVYCNFNFDDNNI